jgi:FixJ family two-component response regulator
MTAYHTPELRRQSVVAGADVFLEKPFRRAALTNAAETALQAARHRESES